MASRSSSARLAALPLVLFEVVFDLVLDMSLLWQRRATFVAHSGPLEGGDGASLAPRIPEGRRHRHQVVAAVGPPPSHGSARGFGDLALDRHPGPLYAQGGEALLQDQRC